MPLLTTRRAALLAGVALLPTAPALAQSVASPPAAQAADQTGTPSPAQDSPDTAPAADNGDGLQDIVVTGQTSRDRPLITSSADITYATRDDIDRRAPRSTADMLELVPGIFVEGTAGEASNNYSVRGLQGGGQRFVQLEEDGMPILYGGGGADFFFQQDLTIDRLEAVKGGSSGVLTVNGAGATINFISKRPNQERFEAIARGTYYNYGLKRADLYVSAPLAQNLAFSIGGYYQSSPGVRRNPFDYDGYRVKAMLEYRFDDGGFLRLSAKRGDMSTAYYASMPYRYDNGEPSGFPGLDTQRDNIGGDAFRNIAVPVSTFVESDGIRNFRYDQGIKSISNQFRIDLEKPVTDTFDVFLRSRYLDYSYDFNGLFPGSGTGNAGLASAVSYLTPGSGSPINDLLSAGAVAFPARVLRHPQPAHRHGDRRQSDERAQRAQRQRLPPAHHAQPRSARRARLRAQPGRALGISGRQLHQLAYRGHDVLRRPPSPEPVGGRQRRQRRAQQQRHLRHRRARRRQQRDRHAER